jgi:hypothetical protein
VRNLFLPGLLFCVPGFAGDVLTYHNDNARTGQILDETILTPANVAMNTFGKLFTISVDGKVDGEPLYASAVKFGAQGTHNVLYVVTEHDSVYAFDGDSGAQLWKVSMLGTGEITSDDRTCFQIEPEIGITSTPVISRTAGPHGALYVAAMSRTKRGLYHQRVHALDLTTGAEQFSGPVDVAATYPGKGDDNNGTAVVFDPKQYKERAALLLLNGIVYTSWASHCDISPYTGWIIGYDASTLTQTQVFNFTPNGDRGSVWMSGAGPASDDAGNIYFLAANGTFDATVNANGFPSNGDFGNAFMKLSVTNNVLGAADFFAMSNVAQENNADTDLGSGGALLLPDMIDAGGATRHLAVGAGKDTHIYLVDRDNMGKFDATLDDNYQDLPGALGSGEFAMPAYFNGAIYYGGVGDAIRKFTLTDARVDTPSAATTPSSFAYPGATPSISANGTSNGIVWAAENTDPAVLHAYDPADLHELYNSNQAGVRDQFGTGNKFITPMIANGKVYVATTTGIGVFGILQPNPVPAITSALSATGVEAKMFSYQITATNNPANFSASNLPAGLTLDAGTGVIGGSPANQGITSVTIGATNANGTGSATLVITISNPGGSPKKVVR